jgi:hypothetical protein
MKQKSLCFLNNCSKKEFILKIKKITLDMLNELIAKLKQDSSSMDKTAESQMILSQFERTLAYIKNDSASKTNAFFGINLKG